MSSRQGSSPFQCLNPGNPHSKSRMCIGNPSVGPTPATQDCCFLLYYKFTIKLFFEIYPSVVHEIHFLSSRQMTLAQGSFYGYWLSLARVPWVIVTWVEKTSSFSLFNASSMQFNILKDINVNPRFLDIIHTKLFLNLISTLWNKQWQKILQNISEKLIKSYNCACDLKKGNKGETAKIKGHSRSSLES